MDMANLTTAQRARMNRAELVRFRQAANGVTPLSVLLFGKEIRQFPYDGWAFERDLPQRREIVVHRIIPRFLGADGQMLVWWSYAEDEDGWYTLVESKLLQDKLIGHAYGWGLPARLLCYRTALSDYDGAVMPV